MLDTVPKPTDRVVLDTLVALVRTIPWGPDRAVLEGEAGRWRDHRAAVANRDREIWNHLNWRPNVDPSEREELFAKRAALSAAIDEARWEESLLALAAQARFPRDGDTAVQEFATSVLYGIEDAVDGSPPRGKRGTEIRLALDAALRAHGLALSDLPRPATPRELVEHGGDKPDYVTDEHWEETTRDFYHRMTLDNTPQEFIYGEP